MARRKGDITTSETTVPKKRPQFGKISLMAGIIKSSEIMQSAIRTIE